VAPSGAYSSDNGVVQPLLKTETQDETMTSFPSSSSAFWPSISGAPSIDLRAIFDQSISGWVTGFLANKLKILLFFTLIVNVAQVGVLLSTNLLRLFGN